MKKIIILFLLFFSVNVYAYENKYFNIDIPEEYKLSEQEEYVYKWENKNNYIAITINSNLKLEYNIETFKEEDLVKQKEYIENGINKGLEKYNITAEVSNVTKSKDNNHSYLEYDIYYPSEKLTGYNMYQKGRMYTTKNYITTIIYSSDKEIKDNEECKTILNSFKIIDTELVIKNGYKRLLLFILIVGGILGIIGGIVSYKKRK